MISHSIVAVFLFVVCMLLDRAVSWTTLLVPRRHRCCGVCLAAKHKQSRSSVVDERTITRQEEEETPAGIEGAQFFGGNKQKEEFYDPVAEAQAGVEGNRTTYYDRFQDRNVFLDDAAADLARDLQNQINAALYNETTLESTDSLYLYGSSLNWDTPFSQRTQRPLDELENAVDFYNRIDMAITSGKSISRQFIELNWELSLVWPTFWEPRVLITGTSTLTLDGNSIVQQQDSLHEPDLLSSLFRQVMPRFWDIYHIGMTPSAEISPKIGNGPFFKGYNLHDLPARLYLQPTLLDEGDRQDETAGIIPNHAFCCVIKTMGPQRQRYVTTTPVQVQLIPTQAGPLELKWKIPLSVEYMVNAQLTVPEQDRRYKWQPRRRVATVAYGGGPQDADIAIVRERLYRQVIRNGLKPKMESGRPVFFFWQNSVKACYTEQGLGMAVYEWRPNWAKTNEVGIELELD